jgi:hypothetical protein
LSRVNNGEEPTNFEENFHDAQLFSVQAVDEYFAKIIWKTLCRKINHAEGIVRRTMVEKNSQRC